MKGIPLGVVIKALTECEVLVFDPTMDKNKELLKILSQAAKLAGQKASQKGIFTARPNEAGNHIEPYVIDALKQFGLNADKPVSKSGRKKVTGYPDIHVGMAL